MTYASTLIEEVSADLSDQWSGDEYARWTEADLLGYLNDAEKMTVTFNPQAYVATVVYRLVAGTKQTLPDGSNTYQSPAGATHPRAIEFVKLSRNMGITGLVDGAAILPIGPRDMEESYPSWRSATAAATVIHSMFDKSDRTRFEVYPRQPAADMGYVEAVYSAVPDLIETSLGSYDVDINLGDEYLPTLKTYMEFRAYSVDAQNSQAAYARALDAWNLFVALIGRKDLVQDKLPTRPSLAG